MRLKQLQRLENLKYKMPSQSPEVVPHAKMNRQVNINFLSHQFKASVWLVGKAYGYHISIYILCHDFVEGNL